VGPGDDVKAMDAVARLPLYDPLAWDHMASRYGIPADMPRPDPPQVEVCSTANLKREAGLPTLMDGHQDLDAVAEIPPQDRYEFPVAASAQFGGSEHLDPAKFGHMLPDMFSNIAEPAMPIHAGEGPGPLQRWPSGAHAREHSQLFQARVRYTLQAWLSKRDLAELLSARNVPQDTLKILGEHLLDGEYNFAHQHETGKPRPMDEVGNVALPSCALVSLDDSLAGRALAEDIELHDSVWRVGADPVDGFEELVGSRTSVRIVDVDTMDLLLQHEHDTHDADHADTRGIWLFVPRSDEDLAQFAGILERASKSGETPFALRSENVAIMNPEWVEHVAENWTFRHSGERSSPSLDSIALHFALRACQSQVSLFGFGMGDSAALHGVESSKRERKSYYGESPMATRVEDVGEREVRWFLHDAGIIVDRSRDGAGHI